MSPVESIPRTSLELSRAAPPQYHDRSTTSSIMWAIAVSLVPAAAWGVYLFGLRALLVVAVSVVSSVAIEWVITRSMHRETISDGSAVLTGLLIGMLMPPAVPLFVVVAANVFAIAVVKWTFGGLGGYWMNPALAARVFVSLSWPGSMTRWTWPSAFGLDGVSAATTLQTLQDAARGGEVVLGGLTGYLARSGFPRSALDANVTEWINLRLLGSFGTVLPGGYIDLLVGNKAGSIGEASIVLLLLGTVILFGRRILTWEIPTAFFIAFASLTWVFGGTLFGSGLFAGDVLFHLLTGSAVFTMFYLATDMTTTPMTGLGLLLFGAGAGALTFLFRAFGGAPEGTAVAVLLMNVLTPAINRATRPRRYGWHRGSRR